jgi:NTP pyrophosphatase (non-canonical NTP hydrolase)
MNLNDLQESTTQWANDRNLIEGTTPDKQFIKLVEEVGEIAACLAKDKPQELKLEIGDALVCLNNLCVQKGFTLNDAFNAAWLKIKDRKGILKDGFFIKENDLT